LIRKEDFDHVAEVLVRIEDILDRLTKLGVTAEMEMPLTKENMALMAKADEMRKEAHEDADAKEGN
jgi:hypothetical protein